MLIELGQVNAGDHAYDAKTTIQLAILRFLGLGAVGCVLIEERVRCGS